MSRGISFENTLAKIGHAGCCRRENELPSRKVAQVPMTLASSSKRAQIWPFGFIWEGRFCHAKPATHIKLVAGKAQ
jgi:hypothetical protein